MRAAVRDRVRDDVASIAESAIDVTELLKGAATAIRRALPVEGWCGFTLDPATVVQTSGVHQTDLSPALLGRLVDLEYRHRDVNLFADLARERRPAAILGEPDSSPRFREVLRPSGYGHELRLVLLDQGTAWGGFVFLREPGSAPFTAADGRFVAGLSRRLAHGVRRALLRSQRGGGRLPHHLGLLFLDSDYRIESMTPGTETLLESLIDEGPSPFPLPMTVGALAATAAVAAPASVRVPTRAGQWATVHGWRLDGPARIALSIECGGPETAAGLALDGYRLSPRERQVTELLLAGQSTGHVAAALFLSAHTVRDHLKSIFVKTGVRSRQELFAVLFRHPHR